MLVAGGLAYAAGRRAGGQGQQEEEYYDEPPPAPPPPAETGATSEMDQLKQLAELHESGVLTDEEFAAEKAKILGT